MYELLRVSRRRLIAAGLIAPAALRAISPGSSATAARQSDPAPWRIADGLRLAGSVSGLASLDPARSRDLATNFVLRQVYRGLMALDANLVPVPELAESVDISADGRTYTFTIREAARFHDGRSVTPEDVQVSLTRALDPQTTGGAVEALAGVIYLQDIEGAADLLAGRTETLAGFTVSGPRTMTITLSSSSPTFLMKLASVPASIIDARQAQAGGEWPERPNGSGPFAVQGWLADESLELAAAESWWPGRAALPRVNIRLGASASQPVNLFQGGEIDLVEDVPPELVDLLRDPATGAPVGDLIETSLFATSYIAFGNTAPPLDDVHVRRALQYVFPSDLVAVATFDGAVAPAAGLLPPGLLDASWPTDRIAGDAAAARESLRRSRYGSAAEAPPIAMYAADIAMVEALREVAAFELGLVVEAIQVAWPDFLSGLAERRFPAYALYWGADYPDPESLVDMLFGAASPENYTGYANGDLDSLLDEARLASGPERIAVYERANQLLMDDAAIIPLYHPIGYTVARPGLGGVTMTPMGILGLETIRER